ncbi:MAG: hypothetical protein ACOCU8_00985 [Patescibacteria group bacterium]
MGFIFSFLIVVVVASAAVAGVEEVPEVSESETLGTELAQIYLRHRVDHFRGHFSFSRQSGMVRGSFRMTPEFWVTRFEVAGEIIFDDPDNPLPGLPENADGPVEGYRINLVGRDSSGRSVLYGHTRVATLDPGDPIGITLNPTAEERFLPYQPEENVDPAGLVLEVDGRIRAVYDPETEGFTFWPDPMVRQSYWRILTGDGQMVATGELDPVSLPTTGEGNPVSVRLAGDVLPIDLVNRQSVSFRVLELSNWEETEAGDWIPARSFTLRRRPGEATYLHLPEFPGQVEVWAHQDWGPMEVVPVAVEYLGGSLIRIFIPGGSEKLVVTISSEYVEEVEHLHLSIHPAGLG